MNTHYDRSTDSLHIKVREIPATTSRVVDDDFVIDNGADGQPVGYEIQHASERQQLVATLILERTPAAAAE